MDPYCLNICMINKKLMMKLKLILRVWWLSIEGGNPSSTINSRELNYLNPFPWAIFIVIYATLHIEVQTLHREVHQLVELKPFHWLHYLGVDSSSEGYPHAGNYRADKDHANAIMWISYRKYHAVVILMDDISGFKLVSPKSILITRNLIIIHGLDFNFS